MLPDAPVRIPQLDDYLPDAVQAVRECLRNALADQDVAEDTLLELSMSVCDMMACLGAVPPSYRAAQERLKAHRRDTAIVNGFDGHNYADLAERHSTSERTVRRIINRYFYKRSEP